MNLERLPNNSGQIEKFGASQAIHDQLAENFTSRGTQVAYLIRATLTETPYTPVMDGTRFELEVSNRYQDDDLEGEAQDTVDIAHEALEEYLNADIPGSRKIYLESYRSRYGKILDALRPSWRTPRALEAAFDEGLVEKARALDIPLKTAAQGIAIVKHAPRKISGLRLSDQPRYLRQVDTHKFLTEHGRVVHLLGRHVVSIAGDYDKYFFSEDPTRRIGRAPGSTIASTIGNRVTQLRTKHTQRQTY